MPRIRTIKPEFPQSESMGKVSREARLLFVLLWTIADDSGRARASSRLLASLLYPYDNDAPGLLPRWLDELSMEGCVVVYSADGNSYLQITNWLKHQKIDRPSQSRFPPFDESSRALVEPSSTDLGPRTMDLGPRTLDQGPREGTAPASLSPKKKAPKVQDINWPEPVSEAVKDGWVAHRKAKRSSVTQLVVDTIHKQAKQVGISLEDAMSFIVTDGYVAFYPDHWVKQNKKPRSSEPDWANTNYNKGIKPDGSF